MLGDIVGPAVAGLRMRGARARALAAATGARVAAEEPPPGVAVGDGIVVLDRVHRFGGGIARLAAADARRRADDAVAAARRDRRRRRCPGSEPTPASRGAAAMLAPMRELGRRHRRRRPRGGRAGDAATALDALARASGCCARTGAARTACATWWPQVETWLAGAVAGLRLRGPVVRRAGRCW